MAPPYAAGATQRNSKKTHTHTKKIIVKDIQRLGGEFGRMKMIDSYLIV